MKFLTVAATAVAVSLDSFMAGFSLSLNKRPTTVLPSAVALITLLLCVAASVGRALSLVSQQAFDYFGAALLLTLAVLSLLRKEERTHTLGDVSTAECLTIGLAVGMDAAIANLSFAAGDLQWVTPLVFALTHYLMVAVGQVMAKRVVLRHTNLFAAVILAVLAATKLL